MTKATCDCCKKEAQNEGNWKTPASWAVFVDAIEMKIDLCDECTKAVRAFIKQREAEIIRAKGAKR